MATKDLSIVISAKEAFKKTFEDLSKSLKKSNRSFSDSTKKSKGSSSAFDDFRNSIKKARKELEKSNKVADKSKKSFFGLGEGVRNAVLALVSLEALKVVADDFRRFEKSISDVNTLFDDSGQKAKIMSEGIKNILREVPKSADELGAGAYQVVSAGISDVNEALFVLDRASRLAVAGLGTVEEAVDLSTSAINSFNLEGEDMNKIFDLIQLTVKSGKTNISELAVSFGTVSGVANSAGVSFEELMASTAALTTTGLKARVAQTQLRSAILAIQAPTEDMKKLFKKLGVESGSTLIKNKGLVGSMEDIKKAAGGNIEVLKKAFGSVEALGASISLTGEQSDDFVKVMDQMREASGTLDVAFKKQSDTFDSFLQIISNVISLINIGLGEAIFNMIKWFKANEAVLHGVVAVIAVFLLPVLKVLITFILVRAIPVMIAFVALHAPLILLAIAIGSVVAGISALLGSGDDEVISGLDKSVEDMKKLKEEMNALNTSSSLSVSGQNGAVLGSTPNTFGGGGTTIINNIQGSIHSEKDITDIVSRNLANQVSVNHGL